MIYIPRRVNPRVFNVFYIVVKVKICELATGNNLTEEWTFLPEKSPMAGNWNHLVNTETGIAGKNFLLLDFDFQAASDEPGDLLALNLVSRKTFWMKKNTIENQIYAKASDVDFDGNEYDRGSLHFIDIVSSSRQINFGRGSIDISYRFEELDLENITIGWFNVVYVYDS